MAIPEKKPYERLSDYLERSLPAELEAGKSRGKATADIIAKFNEPPAREMFAPFIWGYANNAADGGDDDANAYIAAVITAGGALSDAQEAAIQTLFTDLKSNSLYTKLDVLYPMMGGTAASTALNANRTNSAYDITWNGSLTFSSNGVTGNSSGDYGNTNYNLNTFGDPNNFGYGIYATEGNYGEEFYQFGAFDGTNLQAYRGDSTSTIGIAGWSNGARPNINVNVGDRDGQFTGTFSGTTKTLYFKDGGTNDTSVSGTATGTAALPNQPFFLFTLNLNGSSYEPYNGRIQTFWVGESLTSGEVTTINTIINDFNTTLGRTLY